VPFYEDIYGQDVAFDYGLTSNGTLVRAYGPQGQLVAQGTDGGAVLQTVLNLLPATGGAIAFRNEGNAFPWGSVPGLPRGITRKLFIYGDGATITLSTGGPRFLDFNKVADYDTFQNIEIANFTIDVNNIGGRHHVVLGTYAGGVQTSRINVANLLIDDIHTINVPVDSTTTNHRLNIWIVVDMPAASTAASIRNVTVSRVKFEGGNMGIVIGGTGAVATNLTCYDIVIDQWWHSLLTVQTSNFSSSNCQVGSLCNVDRVTISRGFGQYSGDVGVEIDSAQWSLVEDVDIEDAYTTGFYHTNYNAPPNPNEQVNRYRDCRARKLTCTGASSGFFNNINNSVPLNYAQYDYCDWYCNEPTTVTGWGYRALTAQQAIEFNGCRFIREGFTGNAGNLQMFSVTQTGATTTRLVMQNVEIRVNGAISGSPAGKIEGMYIDGGTVELAMDTCRLDMSLTNAGNNTEILMWFGAVNATEVHGRIAGTKFSNTVDAGLNCIFFDSHVTQAATSQLLIERNDFSGLAGAREIVRTDAAANKAQTRTRGNVWKTIPIPVAFTGLVTATGKALATMWDAMVVFTAATGTSDTAIDWSTNGGTTYTNFLTQASGALPAGFNQSLGPLTSDALIKVTFTGTQPTITLVPVNP